MVILLMLLIADDLIIMTIIGYLLIEVVLTIALAVQRLLQNDVVMVRVMIIPGFVVRETS